MNRIPPDDKLEPIVIIVAVIWIILTVWGLTLEPIQ